jgi:uncharacterized protein YdcH (DUF465 family)
MKHGSYFTRALQANDSRYARVFEKLGYSRADLAATDVTPQPDAEAEIARLRDEYQTLVGKKPYHGWDAATLTEKIAAAKPAD